MPNKHLIMDLITILFVKLCILDVIHWDKFSEKSAILRIFILGFKIFIPEID
jgi:hypothetical protein